MRKRFFIFIGVASLLAVVLVGWLAMEYRAFAHSPMTVKAEGVLLGVKPGMSLNAVARSLQREQLIDNYRYFVWLAKLRGKAASLQAGEYQVDSGMTPEQLLQRMVSGKVQQYALTLIEGITFREMMRQINGNPYLNHTLTDIGNEELMVRIGHAGEHPEGRFLPETYYFPRGMSDVEFLRRAYRAMAEKLDHEWRNREEGLPLKSAYEALVLASIVEKETGLESERPEIAGVFIRRLKKGMRLQTDPTVIYGMGLDFDGNIRRRDLLADTPYNTYTRSGLPPSPIAMPGADAVHAAVNPDDGDSLYFVARGDGSHYFSSSLAEHNRAVSEYQLKGRRKDYSSSPSR
jgi:UPF0755 protein